MASSRIATEQPGPPVRLAPETVAELAAALTTDPRVLADAVAVRVVEALGDEFAEVAERLAERLGGVGAGGPSGVIQPAPTPLTAREVMVRLGRSYDFVRDHRQELGVLAVEGDRPRLLFDAEAVERFARAAADRGGAAIGRQSPLDAGSPSETGVRRRRRRRRLGTDAALLPVRGLETPPMTTGGAA